jgi:hypothetical protein
MDPPAPNAVVSGRTKGESPSTFVAAGAGSALQKRTRTQGMVGWLAVALGWQQLSPFKPLACQASFPRCDDDGNNAAAAWTAT